MANNTPITARVNKGLFGKKSLSTTEPLLNVGAAGVSGNNQTRDIPSPSKMKSAFKMMTSPFKNDPDIPYAVSKTGTPGTSTKGAGAILVEGEQKTKTIPGQKVERLAKKGTPEYDRWLEAVTNDPSIEDKYKPREVPDGEKKPDTYKTGSTTETTPGSLESDQLYTRDKGDAQTALDRRGNIRAGIVSARKEKGADIKVAKAEAKLGYSTDSEGNKTTISDSKAYTKKAKLEAKVKQAKTNQKVAAGETKGAKTQSEANIKGSSAKDVKGEGRKLSLADMTTADQEALHAKNRAAEAKSKTFTEANGTSGANPTELSTTKLLGVDIPASDAKTNNGFFAKKSALKMKYFK